jgi:deoxyribodipyrimidine photo-lyase
MYKACTNLSEDRLRILADQPARGGYVLYWMTANRRTRYNPSLSRAIGWSRQLQQPLVVIEAVSTRTPHASPRTLQPILDGMEDQAHAFKAAGVPYAGMVDPWTDDVTLLARGAAVVVTDDHPGRLYRPILANLANLPCRVEAIDGVGVVPLSRITRPWKRAADFRRHRHVASQPVMERPLVHHAQPPGEVPNLKHRPRLDVAGPPPGWTRGGQTRALELLRAFDPTNYTDGRSHPDRDAESHLSAHLHYGHIAAQELVAAIDEPTLLDQLLTWRELAHNTARWLPDFDRYDSLPAWAKQTLDDHRSDPRHVLSFEQLEQGETGDEVWDAAQRQLVAEGRMPNSVRMLWGKRVLTWSASPEQAWERLFTLNDRYAMDGRDPNSVAGISWCFGRYDRPWPTRAVFGKVRCMTSASSRRKWRMRAWLARWLTPRQPELFGARATGK